jgi:predicted lipoprotein with Yx(FWY)xxD motif
MNHSRISHAAACGAIVIAAITGITLAGCATIVGPASNSTTAPSGASSTPAAIKTASSSLGQIVVDGMGMTAYFFDKDVAGSDTSACTGPCATLWPAITSAAAKPSVSGVSGTVATITDADGSRQITINGRPIYTFANDKKAGDVNGEGVGKVWYAVSSSGDELSSPPATSKY